MRKDPTNATPHAAKRKRPAHKPREQEKRHCIKAKETGWIALDGGQLPLARPLYEEARELAAGSGDAMLGVHVLTNQSMLCAELARTGPSREPARQALRLAFQAQDEGRYLPVARLHALIALRHASAASLLGDKAAFLGRSPRRGVSWTAARGMRIRRSGSGSSTAPRSPGWRPAAG
jgi:hypothetical protein